MPHHERDGGPFASFDHCVSVAQVACDRLLDKYCATSSRSGLDSRSVLGFRRSYNHRVEVTYTVKQGLDARISPCAHLLGDLRRYFGPPPPHPPPPRPQPRLQTPPIGGRRAASWGCCR